MLKIFKIKFLDQIFKNQEERKHWRENLTQITRKIKKLAS